MHTSFENYPKDVLISGDMIGKHIYDKTNLDIDTASFFHGYIIGKYIEKRFNSKLDETDDLSDYNEWKNHNEVKKIIKILNI